MKNFSASTSGRFRVSLKPTSEATPVDVEGMGVRSDHGVGRPAALDDGFEAGGAGRGFELDKGG